MFVLSVLWVWCLCFPWMSKRVCMLLGTINQSYLGIFCTSRGLLWFRIIFHLLACGGGCCWWVWVFLSTSNHTHNVSELWLDCIWDSRWALVEAEQEEAAEALVSCWQWPLGLKLVREHSKAYKMNDGIISRCSGTFPHLCVLSSGLLVVQGQFHGIFENHNRIRWTR